MKTKDRDVALTLANITSKTRVRLNDRGVAVDSPASHAERLVRFFTRVMNEPYTASPEHSERVINDFNQMEKSLAREVRR